MGNISLKEMNDNKVEKMESNFNHNDSFENDDVEDLQNWIGTRN